MGVGNHLERSRPQVISGWPLLGFASAALLAMTALILLNMGANPETVRLLIRLTGRTSLIFFCLAFSAAALARIAPSRATVWLRANRRYLGLGFVVSHLVHAALLAAFWRIDTAAFATATNPAMFVFGGIGYVFVLLMGATSFDASAAWLGPRAWRMLHLVGGYYLSLIFLQAEAKRAADPFHWPFLAIVIAMLFARLVAGRFPAREGARYA
jgi:sulfoxide reductase heme-binding subunit YedZ